MNARLFARPALVVLMLILAWPAGAAPYGSEQNGNEQDKAPTPSECERLVQQRQDLLEQYGDGSSMDADQDVRANMNATARKRLDELEKRLKRCQ